MENLYFVVHTHWDREWYQTFQHMRARLVAMTDKMLPMVERGELPFFHFDGQTIVLEDYLELRPHNAGRLRKLIRAGKIQVGPWYVLADSFLVSGESLIRNLELGGEIARRFGEALQIGYLPDQFGHIAQMPQILAGFGLHTSVLWRGVGEQVRQNRFRWQALDGSSVFTVYLPYGYSNGANLPLDTGEGLARRLADIVDKEQRFADGLPILVMNGTDHAEPRPQVVKLLNELAAADPNLRYEVGTLENYLKRLAELPADGIATVSGELRSPRRAHLLPGVTSARTWIKQRDFHNCYLLERMADPLAVLAAVSGSTEDFQTYIDLAWKTELQNHPHDSICGCSIDQVHRDMRYRFDQAEMLANMVIRRASAAVLQAGSAGSAPGIAVFNPGFSTIGLVSGEADIKDPAASWSALGPSGEKYPLAVEPLGSGQTLEIDLPIPVFKAMVAGLDSPVLMDRAVSSYELAKAAVTWCDYQLDLYIGQNPITLDELSRFKARVAAELPDSGGIIRVRAVEQARARIAFVTRELSQTGFTHFGLLKNATAEKQVGGEAIENQFYRVSATQRGLAIRDLVRNCEFQLYLEDEGDRGDEYNFDPLPEPPVSRPERIELSETSVGAARSRIALMLSYQIPTGLTADRARRSGETVALKARLSATLYPGLDRIDFDLEVENQVRDHRLRVAVDAPLPVSESLSDTAFGIVRRPIGVATPPGVGTEDVYPTAPQRSFTAIESPDLSLAMVSRGIYEIEARATPNQAAPGTTLLLTLLRCVGFLSRADLKTRRGGAGPIVETPEAQEIGSHRFEFALFSYSGSHTDHAVAQRAASYACPPRAFAAARNSADGGQKNLAEFSLVRCDNPRICFSTARLAAGAHSVSRPAAVTSGRRGGAPDSYLVRVFSVSSHPEQARFWFAAGWTARTVDLRGRPMRPQGLRRTREGGVQIEMRPYQIVTLEVRRARRKKF